MLRIVLAAALSCTVLYAQDTAFPLESIAIEGSALPKETVLEMTGFRVGTPIHQAGIEAGCKKLGESGLFQDIGYRYAPGPQHGYVVTITLSDQTKMREASVDIPGVDSDEIWQWLTSKFPPFNRKVPDIPAAQDYLAKLIEQHYDAALAGQHVVSKLEQEFTPRLRTIVSFQPANLPVVGQMSFSGQQKLSAEQLNSIMQKVVAGQGYIDRRFRALVELNLRPAYEELGMYRVRFPRISAQKAGESAVNVAVEIEEGAQFTLGAVSIAGDDLPKEEMLKAANLKPGGIANWTHIQQGIWDMERPVKRLGFYSASSAAQRVLHDDTRVIDVSVSIQKGPLYHFGEVTFAGLSPSQEQVARKHWTAAPGSSYEFLHSNDFLREFSRAVDLRQFKKYNVQTKAGAGGHVMDVTVIFETK